MISPSLARSASVTDSIWNQTAAVAVILTTGTTGIQLLNDTVLFSKHAVPTVQAPSNQSVAVSMYGLNNSNAVIWSGSVVLPASTNDTNFVILASAVTQVGGSGISAGNVNSPIIDSMNVAPWATDTFDQAIHVYLSTTTPNAKIHYTLDGSYPTTKSLLYNDTGILIDSSATIIAMSTKEGWTNSSSITKKITLKVQPISVNASNYLPPFKFSFDSPTKGVAIYYSKNGTTPTTASNKYLDSLDFGKHDDSTTYSAIAISTVNPKISPSEVLMKKVGSISPWNKDIKFDSITDLRDNQVYRTVKIGSQTWMAENLNFTSSNSNCYDDAKINCQKYGRLYFWSDAMGIDRIYDSISWLGSDTASHAGICPSGWRLPRYSDWGILRYYAYNTIISSKSFQLTAKGTWASDSNTDVYGFRALLAGRKTYWDGKFNSKDTTTGFHSVTEYGSLMSFNMGTDNGSGVLPANYGHPDMSESHVANKTVKISVRCIKIE